MKSEARSLSKHEIEDFEFLLGMIIWHNRLAQVNNVTKILQTKDMHIDVAIRHLKVVMSFVQK